MDYKIIRVELLQKLRGGRSKNSLNKKLHFSYDKIGHWEQASSLMDWSDFVDYLATLGVPLESHLHKFINYDKNLSDGNALARFITNGFAHDEVVWRTKISYSRVRRIMTDSAPKVWEILILLDRFATRTLLIDLVQDIAGGTIQSFEEEERRSRLYSELLKSNRLYRDVLSLMSHADIENGVTSAVDLISDKIDEEREVVRGILEDLATIEVIGRKGDDYRYDETFIPLGQTFEETAKNALEYMQRLSKVLEHRSEIDSRKAVSYCTGMVSKETYTEIQNELQQLHFKIVQMMSRKEPNKTMSIAYTLSLFDPYAVPKKV